ncbi:MAG: hypothetical protein ACYTFY_09930 [Planctomycetota bacterium]
MLNQDYKEMLSALKEEQAEFILVGAYALAAHGFPRATGDIDILVNPTEENSKKVFSALLKFGAPIENITEEDFSKDDVIFQIGLTPRRIDIITSIESVTFPEAWEDAISIQIEGIPVISKEKMIKNKQSTGRDKDLIDAKTLLDS